MGIPELREQIEACEEIEPLAKLAEDHYKNETTKGQPFKVAIEAADWSFHNVSPEKVKQIRKYEPAANPIEKEIFRRICRLLTSNIRPVYVFDGANVPPKRGWTAGRIVNSKGQALLKQILDGLGVPYIEALGEAEAECCRLQVLKLVDAVWSMDSDCLMFGCTLWIRDYRRAKDASKTSKSNGDTEKDKKVVRVVRAERLQAKFGLKREGCVLFAMLAGGDYGNGLLGCGRKTVLEVARAGLGLSLCTARNQADCKRWRGRLLIFFAKKSIKIPVPENYPRFELLQWYNNPMTHSDDFLRQHAAQNMHYEMPVQESELLQSALPTLNMTRLPYLRHVGPVLLSQYIAGLSGSLPPENVYDIKLKNTRTSLYPSLEGQIFPVLERTFTFCRNDLTSIPPVRFDNWEAFKAKNQSAPYDSTCRVECDMPVFLLEKVLSVDVLHPSERSSMKRKNPEDPHNSPNTRPTVRKKNNGSAVSNKPFTTSDRFSHHRTNFAPTNAANFKSSTPPIRRPNNSVLIGKHVEIIKISD